MNLAASLRRVFAMALALGCAATASAQVARVGGIVKDQSGQPIKGATIRAENPDAPLGTITSATDDKGRFAIIGLARGRSEERRVGKERRARGEPDDETTEIAAAQRAA